MPWNLMEKVREVSWCGKIRPDSVYKMCEPEELVLRLAEIVREAIQSCPNSTDIDTEGNSTATVASKLSNSSSIEIEGEGIEKLYRLQNYLTALVNNDISKYYEVRNSKYTKHASNNITKFGNS
jgi:hypothetical protein